MKQSVSFVWVDVFAEQPLPSRYQKPWLSWAFEHAASGPPAASQTSVKHASSACGSGSSPVRSRSQYHSGWATGRSKT